ncbi:hypothetical protein [Tenacibaculum jejuense]|uniref:Membrane or secreted protein n=1 Tax=Tenacibaculum jejuense TaxID=584609 RepID=A0A238UEN5_9FLAO|nr:hypothetical protein [Tenacibaculum jejuense]SNR17663.1 Membrane or secreted protein [Tenacibaculum jejuense]
MKIIKTKKIIFPLFILAIVSCGSYQFEKKPPFKILSGTYTSWVGGVRGVSGVNINLVYSSEQKVKFEHIFYRGRKATVSYKKGNGSETSILGQFRNQSDDLQLHDDPRNEYGNTVPKDAAKEDFPFKLDGNEVVISYIEDGRVKYFKYSGLTQGKQVLFQ